MFLGATNLKPEQIENLPASFRDTLKAGKELSAAQKVQLTAISRLKLANHPRLVAKVESLTTRLAAVDKSLAEYEQSNPPAGKAGSAVAAPSDKDFMQAVADDMHKLDSGR